MDFNRRFCHPLTTGFIVLNYFVDFSLKLWSCPKLLPFLTSYNAIIDYFSILPFVIEVALFNSINDRVVIYILRILKMVRFLRLLGILDGNSEMSIFLKAVQNSKSAIIFLIFFILSFGTFYATCVFYAELSICKMQDGVWIYNDSIAGAANGTPSVMQNILDALWWAIVTMSTLGYGDIVPKSVIGKCIASVTIVTAVVFMNLPMAIVAANLTELYAERRLEAQAKKRAKKLKRERRLIRALEDDSLSVHSTTSAPIESAAIDSVESHDSFPTLPKSKSLLKFIESIKSNQRELEENLSLMKETMASVNEQNNHVHRLVDQIYKVVRFNESEHHSHHRSWNSETFKARYRE